MRGHRLKSLLGAQVFDFPVQAVFETDFKGKDWWPCCRVRGLLRKPLNPGGGVSCRKSKAQKGDCVVQKVCVIEHRKGGAQ